MRVGLVIYGSLETVSGGFLYDRMLIGRLREHGDHVSVISMPWRPYVWRFLDNLTYRNTNQFDVLLQDELNHPSLLAANSGSRMSPVVSVVHHLRSAEPRPRWQNRIFEVVERHYLRSVDGFIFNSSKTQASVSRLVAAGRPHVIAAPGGGRLGVLSEKQVLARAKDTGPLRLMFLGNLTPRKGLHVALAALALLSRADFELDVLGSTTADPAYARRMQLQSSRLGLRVNYSGSVDDETLHSRLAHAQALLLPSAYEGFGIAYLEGMAHGLPAIGTTRGAPDGLILDNVNGFLVQPGDAQGLANCLSQLFRSRNLLADVSIGALRHYLSQPSWEQSMERARDFLLSIAGNTTSGSQ